MKSIKTFEDFFNGNTSESNDNYPPGAANDPSAPWNKEDYDTDREVNLKPSEIKFEVIATDHREFAILKEKATGKMFMVGFEPSEMEEYVEYEMIPVGRDEDGIEYEYEYMDPDDYAIEAFATEKVRNEGTGKGLYDFESSKVAEIDMELAKDMYDSLVQFLDKYSSSNTRKDEIKKVQKMVEVLKGLLENLK
jgi:hypothetical protein